MSEVAKEHSLDIKRISGIEFPLKVKNVDKALALVGGMEKVKKVLADDENNRLELRFNPTDIFEHPIQAKASTASESIVLKISVPKGELAKNGNDIGKTLASCGRYKIQPVAIANKTFRFREMSDFQYTMENDPIANKIKRGIHDRDYDELKELAINRPMDATPWESNIDPSNELFSLPPPPRFSSIPLPFKYEYRENTSTKRSKEGKLIARSEPMRVYYQRVGDFHRGVVPTEPVAEFSDAINVAINTGVLVLDGKETSKQFRDDMLNLIDILKQLFEQRPLWVRRHLEVKVPIKLRSVLKHALPYVSYTFSKGPWRQTCIKYGVDPRTSSEYAKYQRETYRIPGIVSKNLVLEQTDISGDVPKEYIYDGTEIPPSLILPIDAIVEPKLLQVLNKGTIMTKADEANGWYDELTMYRFRKLIKYQLQQLAKNQTFQDIKMNIIMNLPLKAKAEEDGDDEVEEEMAKDVQSDEEEREDAQEQQFDIDEATLEKIAERISQQDPDAVPAITKLSGLVPGQNVWL